MYILHPSLMFWSSLFWSGDGVDKTARKEPTATASSFQTCCLRLRQIDGEACVRSLRDMTCLYTV
jgi:hypothetical protein